MTIHFRRVCIYIATFLVSIFMTSHVFAAVNKTVLLDGAYTGSAELQPFDGWSAIKGLTVSGDIELEAENALVRVILIDKKANEYLAYEVYPMIAPRDKFTIDTACEETCSLESVKPVKVKLEIINAKVSNITLTREELSPIVIRNALADKLKKIRQHIKDRQLSWQVGDTKFSNLSYADKKRFFNGKVPNLQGFEYYKGGIFRVPSDKPIGAAAQMATGQTAVGAASPASPALVKKFDWRAQHNANIPGSPYYDGNTDGSGWLTDVHQQASNDCWVFSGIGATEALVNLYFNDHINLDLSEQNIIACARAGVGGLPGFTVGGYVGGDKSTLAYIARAGVVDESCSPYLGRASYCATTCQNPTDKIQIAGHTRIENDDEAIKRAILENGPITGGILSWLHFFVIFGFDQDPVTGETIWLFKNSWGTGWGNGGYAKVILDINQLYGLYKLETPLTSNVAYTIDCNDLDNDGYYNWGISKQPPATCPQGIPAEKDCNDADPTLLFMDSDGHCMKQCSVDADCDDGDSCTVDSCTADSTCSNQPKCDDGIFCNGYESCVAGVCQPATPVNCADENICTVDSCNVATDRCQNIPNPTCTCLDLDEICTVNADCCTNNCVPQQVYSRCKLPRVGWFN